MIVPARDQALSSQEVVPGYCVEATVCLRGETSPDRDEWRVQSMYLPPDTCESIAQAYCHQIGNASRALGTLTVVGDLNLQIWDPRDDTEVALTESLVNAWQSVGTTVVEHRLHTRRNSATRSTPDHVAVPARPLPSLQSATGLEE